MAQVHGAIEWCKFMVQVDRARVQVDGASEWRKCIVQVHGASERRKYMVQVHGASGWSK